MLFRENVEVRVSSIVLAILAVVMALLLFRPDSVASVFRQMDDGHEMILGILLLTSGCMQALGAVLPRRRLRQIGLILSSIGWFALCGALMKAWLFYSLVVALIGLATFFSLLKDVRGKPREKCIGS